MNNEIMIGNKKLSEFKDWEKLKKAIENNLSSIDELLMNLIYGGVEECLKQLKIEWNKTQNQEEQINNVKNTKNNQSVQLKNKTLQKNDIVEVLIEPFKGKKAKVIDISNLGIVYVKFNDKFENKWTFNIEDVKVIKKEWKDIKIKTTSATYFYIMKNKIMFINDLTGEKTSLDFTQKEINILTNKYKNKEDISKVLLTGNSIINKEKEINKKIKEIKLLKQDKDAFFNI